MTTTRTKAEAEAAMTAAGFTVATDRTRYEAGLGLGLVYSVEQDHAVVGHALHVVGFTTRPTVCPWCGDVVDVDGGSGYGPRDLDDWSTTNVYCDRSCFVSAGSF